MHFAKFLRIPFLQKTPGRLPWTISQLHLQMTSMKKLSVTSNENVSFYLLIYLQDLLQGPTYKIFVSYDKEARINKGEKQTKSNSNKQKTGGGCETSPTTKNLFLTTFGGKSTVSVISRFL